MRVGRKAWHHDRATGERNGAQPDRGRPGDRGERRVRPVAEEPRGHFQPRAAGQHRRSALELRAQRAPGTREQRANGGLAQLQAFRELVVAEAADFAQQQHVSLAAGESGDRPPRLGQLQATHRRCRRILGVHVV